MSYNPEVGNPPCSTCVCPSAFTCLLLETMLNYMDNWAGINMAILMFQVTFCYFACALFYDIFPGSFVYILVVVKLVLSRKEIDFDWSYNNQFPLVSRLCMLCLSAVKYFLGSPWKFKVTSIQPSLYPFLSVRFKLHTFSMFKLGLPTYLLAELMENIICLFWVHQLCLSNLSLA